MAETRKHIIRKYLWGTLPKSTSRLTNYMRFSPQSTALTRWFEHPFSFTTYDSRFHQISVQSHKNCPLRGFTVQVQLVKKHSWNLKIRSSPLISPSAFGENMILYNEQKLHFLYHLLLTNCLHFSINRITPNKLFGPNRTLWLSGMKFLPRFNEAIDKWQTNEGHTLAI